MIIGQPRVQLPDVLRRMLALCQQFERIASGSNVRISYRVTRSLIAALLAEGYPAPLIAEHLGVTAGSVTTRGSAPTTIEFSALTRVPGLPDVPLSSWLESETALQPIHSGTIVDLRDFVACFAESSAA